MTRLAIFISGTVLGIYIGALCMALLVRETRVPDECQFEIDGCVLHSCEDKDIIAFNDCTWDKKVAKWEATCWHPDCQEKL